MFPLLLLILLASSAIAQQTIYFYPPDDAKWISGRSYISQGTAATSVPLEKDQTSCGWYRASIPNSSPLLQYSQFWLGKAGTDRIGPNGRWLEDFDPEDDFNAVGGVFKLGEKFAQLGNTLYLVADELERANPNAGWHTTRPDYMNDMSRCRFNLAAIIYDTDISVHPDFSCAEYYQGVNDGNGKNIRANCTMTAPYSSVSAYNVGGNLKGECVGVHRGTVQSTLDPITRKIKYNAAGDKWKCWTSEEWFNRAFNPTDGVNVQRCYDMPFSQVASGSFEFDSDKMLNASGRLVGGFFPEILTNRAGADYSKCPNCDAKRPFESFAPLIKWITPDIFDNYTPVDGDFSEGDIPSRTRILASAGGTATYGVWNWADISETPNNRESETRQGLTWYLHGNTAIKGSDMAPANGFFCFESHANFIYDPEQEFIFRGDDDIWVYINNKLVIDLGGTHLAAPGKVRLSTLGLIDGAEYPIDIFFCDRRSTMSNVRISTNMYVAQKSAFYFDQKNNQNVMCASITTGADCASVMSGGKTSEMCGADLVDNGYTVDFYMIDRVNKDTVWLSGTKNEEDCRGDANIFSCFNNGIRVENGVYRCGGKGRCKGDEAASARVAGINGNFNVYSRLMDRGKPLAGSKPLLIDNIRSGETTPIIPRSFFANNIKARVNGNAILLENLPTGAKVELYNLQGKRIYFHNSENPELRIGVQTKGMYIIKVSLGNKTVLTFNRSIYE